MTINFFGCSKESNNQQGGKIETGQLKTSDSNKTDIEKSGSNTSLVNVKPKPEPNLVYEKGIPDKKTIDMLTEQEESKNESLPESNTISSINSKLAEANQSKSKIESAKIEIRPAAKENKVVLNDSKNLDANISINAIDVPLKLDDVARKKEQRLIKPDPTPNFRLFQKLPSSKPSQKSKYPVWGYYRLHRGLPKP